MLPTPLLPDQYSQVHSFVVGGAIGFSYGVNGTSPGTSPSMSQLYNTNGVLSNSPSRVAGELEDQGAIAKYSKRAHES